MNRTMYGSETFPKFAWENWEMVKRHSYVFGDFVWTGMDYIGESGIGHNDFIDEQSRQQISFLKPWPWYVSWCGDIDILGNKKPQSHYRDVLWGESKLEVMGTLQIDSMDKYIAEKNALAFIIVHAAGNGGPEHQGSFTDDTFNLFRGKGMVIIRLTGEPGSITVEVSSKGLKPASITLEAN